MLNDLFVFPFIFLFLSSAGREALKTGILIH